MRNNATVDLFYSSIYSYNPTKTEIYKNGLKNRRTLQQVSLFPIRTVIDFYRGQPSIVHKDYVFRHNPNLEERPFSSLFVLFVPFFPSLSSEELIAKESTLRKSRSPK